MREDLLIEEILKKEVDRVYYSTVNFKYGLE